MRKPLLVLLSASIALHGCAAMQSIDASPDPGHHWVGPRAAEPAVLVLFRVRTPAEIEGRVRRPARAAATVGGPVCIVDFTEPWHEVPLELLAHELRHCAGWRHQ
jgi:hypothetical protein